MKRGHPKRLYAGPQSKIQNDNRPPYLFIAICNLQLELLLSNSIVCAHRWKTRTSAMLNPEEKRHLTMQRGKESAIEDSPLGKPIPTQHPQPAFPTGIGFLL